GGTLHLHGAIIARNITMNNGASLQGSVNGPSGRSNGTLTIASGADVTFFSTGNPTGLVIGDGTNDLTGGGSGSSITLASGATTLISASDYVGDWIVQNTLNANNDNRFGNAANTVTLDNGALVSFASFTTSRQFILAGMVPAVQSFFGGTMTFNSGLTGTFDTFNVSGDG